jgi:uncharacterized glyoxalase superfamily protein PhnB
MKPNIIPAVRYQDPGTALDWLKKVFGFEEKAVYRGEDGTIGHAEIRLGAGMIMLGPSKEDGWLGGGRPDPLASTISIYVVVDDPAAHYEQAKVHGATIVRGLENMDYGSLEYSARDPEGNLWSFGTYDPF